MQGRIPTIRNHVTAITTPGNDIDAVVTDYGIAVNPKRKDLLKAAEKAGLLLKTMEELRDIAYRIGGEPARLNSEERVVAVIEARDGTIMDVVRKRRQKIF